MRRRLSTTLLAAGIVLLSWTAKAQYVTGDLMIGFEAGGVKDVLLDLGPAQTYVTATAPFNINIANLNAALITAFGSAPGKNTNILTAVFGNLNPSDPNNTLYASRPHVNALSGSQQSSRSSNMSAVESQYNNDFAAAQTPALVQDSSQESNSYLAYVVGGKAFQNFITESQFSLGTLSLDRIPSTNSGQATRFLGTITFSFDAGGNLTAATFSPALPPTITSPASATGVQGQPFNYQITASGNPASFGATGLPPGLELSATTPGLITGTPTALGNFQVTLSATNSAGTGTATLSLTITATQPPPAITSTTSANGVQGQPFTYQITATGNPTSFGATPLPVGLIVDSSTGLISGTPTATGTFSITISAINPVGTGTATLVFTVTAAPPPVPTITSPASASALQGQTFNYQITASGTPTSFGASPLPAGLVVDSATGLISGTPATSGNFTIALSATNPGGTGTATLLLTISATPNPAATFANISTRGLVGAGDNVLIAGLIVTGSGPKKIILRAIGAATGVAGALADPRLELHDASGAQIVANDNWKDTQEVEIRATGLAPRADRDSALVRTVDPGSYTAIMRGAGSTTGVGLVEVYDLDLAAPAKLANISTRGFVGTSQDVLIGGLIVGAGAPAEVVVRGIGPSTGMPNALNDPILTLHDSNGQVIFANDNWADSQEGEIRATDLQPLDDKEAAISATLAPGGYTAILAGKGSSTGIGLIEAYRLSP